MKHLILIILSFIVHIPLVAQQIIARQIPFYHQLASNEIRDFYQDKEGYIWIGTTSGLARYDGYRLQSFRSDYKSPELLTNNSILCMADNTSYVWIGTEKGLNLYEKETCRMLPVSETLLNKEINKIHIDCEEQSWIASEGSLYKCDRHGAIIKQYKLSGYYISQIYGDREGNIWVLTWSGGLLKYSPDTDTFIVCPRIGQSNNPDVMFQDKSGNYWIGTWGDGLWQFYPERIQTGDCYRKHHLTNSVSGKPEPSFFSITQDDTFGYLWALSYNELYALKITESGTLEKIDINHLLDPHKMYTRIFKDRNSNLWLSSYDMPYIISFDSSPVENYPLPQIKERLGYDANIINLGLGNDSLIWLNQDRYGLTVYDPVRDKLSDNTIKNESGSLNAKIITSSRFKEGVWVSREKSTWFRRIAHNSNLQMYMAEEFNLHTWTNNPGEINQLIEDKNGNLWILTTERLFLKPLNSDSLIVTEPNILRVLNLTKDTAGEIWGMDAENNLFSFHATDNKITSVAVTSFTNLPANDWVKHICIDKKNCLWVITTLGRIYKSDSSKQVFHKQLLLEEKINESSVLDICADQESIWIVTNKVAIQYNLNQETIRHYASADANIIVNIFRHKAIEQDNNGGLYVGGHGGFTHIRPHIVADNQTNILHPAVTDVKVENQSIFFSKTETKSKHPNTIRNIYLNARDKNIEILFSTLDYSLHSPKRIAYKLEGIDSDWTYPDDNQHSAFYNHLPKGTYKFWLKLESSNGEWSDYDVLLTIEKHPALYETWYVRFCYFLLAALTIFLLLHVYMRRMKNKNAIRFKEELNKAKLDYFTNVSHELLTPLTVISCTVDSIDTGREVSGKQSTVLKSNIKKLKYLIQQVLDFRKMDLDAMQLQISRGDINAFVTDICHTVFLPLTQKKDITLIVKTGPEEFTGYLDFDKLDKILHNLLSNAIKYTPEHKRITVAVSRVIKEGEPRLLLTVEDEGIGIPPKEKELIFTRFYNNKNHRGVESNGIGLSLTKDLVTLHRGTISVQSEPDKGSCFSVELPVGRECYAENEFPDDIIPGNTNISASEMSSPDVQTSSADTEKMTLLIVDDNTELLYILKELFLKTYHVLTATSASEAWKILHDDEVDIVISDVMMPDENGWDFCKRIKDDLQFSHIPVIILTARNDADDQVRSYESGADGYVGKPFELKVLAARIDNLIKSYKIRQQAFRKEESLNLDTMSYPAKDKQFLQSVVDYTMLYIQETDFDLEQLAAGMKISKSTLYRKIKSMTGMPPLEFIRNIKMKHSCTLLLSGTLTISEVAYALGFDDPKYFSKRFKEAFGVTPSEYRNR